MLAKDVFVMLVILETGKCASAWKQRRIVLIVWPATAGLPASTKNVGVREAFSGMVLLVFLIPTIVFTTPEFVT